MQKIIYSVSFLEFLKSSSSKVASVLYRLHNKRYTPLSINCSEINYITFRKDATISYLPANKELILNSEGNWSKENRQNGKPSKVIRKLFTPRFLKMFKDSDFENFTNDYKSTFNESEFIFTMLDNTHIKDVYNCTQKSSGEGSLNNSCMNGKGYNLDLYEKCESLRILVLKNNKGELCGRCLVWDINNITLLDRFYTNEDCLFQKFIYYAKENNFWYKKNYKSYDDKETFINSEGKEVNEIFEIKTDTDFSCYPYIDTFSYGNDGSLTNNSEDTLYTYSCTGGDREETDTHEGQTWDDIDNEYIDEDNAVYIDYGERRYRNNTTHIDNCIMVDDNFYHKDDCNICEVNGDYYLTDSDSICQVNGDYHLADDCAYCERDNCYYLSEDCVYCDGESEDILRDEAVKIDDNWYHQDSELITNIDDEYYLIDSDKIELINGIYILKIEETI